jgi:hypothetical protein
VRRLKQLEAENARLKKFVAERDLEIEVMKEVAAKELVSVPARRRQVGHEEAVVIERMKELSAQYPRYGRRIRRSYSPAGATRLL